MAEPAMPAYSWTGRSQLCETPRALLPKDKMPPTAFLMVMEGSGEPSLLQ